MLEPGFDPLPIFQDFFSGVVRVDVDADRADDPEVLALDWDRRAFEFTAANVELVVQFVFVFSAFEINQQIRSAVAQTPPGHVVFQGNERMRRVGQIMQQNLYARVRKRFPDQPNHPLVVFQELVRVIGDLLAVILVEQLRVNFLLGWFKLRSDVVLFANEYELARRGMVFVLQEIMHSEPKIFQTELAKVLATNCERVEIIFVEVSPEFPAAFLVFSPNETGREKDQRRDNGRDYVDSDLALQCANHGSYLIEKSTIATPLQISSRI